MPRPGPRPYECVRRAWHSDRHQPIRGSLIKEIFRVAKEIHSSSTKQNKEWQEKLPTVVLKAEEIMYSKANSEAEYMDLKTLWDRTNDAINTIIRREESSETGDFLQPCIEAALNLGCTLRRASRSQRNCHPRCYLSPNAADFENAAKTPNSGSIRRSPLPQNTNKTAMKRVSVPENVKPPNPEKLSVNSFSAYPLYYGTVAQIEPLCGKGIFAPNPPCLEDSRGSCDLSLRLGQSIPVLDKEFSLVPRSNAFEPLGSLKGLKPGEASVRKRKAGFDFDQPVTLEDQRFCLKPKLPFRNPTGS